MRSTEREERGGGKRGSSGARVHRPEQQSPANRLEAFHGYRRSLPTIPRARDTCASVEEGAETVFSTLPLLAFPDRMSPVFSPVTGGHTVPPLLA